MTLSQLLQLTIKNGQETVFDKIIEEDSTNLTNNEYTAQQILIADGETDLSINMCGISSATFLAIITDQALTYKYNGAGSAIPASATGMTILNTSGLTSLTISNASGTAANVTIILGAY